MGDSPDDFLNDDGEVVVALADGCTLRSGIYDEASSFLSGEYVRLCDASGEELLYWDQEEWRSDPALVMGAIMNSAAGLRVKREGEGNGGTGSDAGEDGGTG